MFTQRSRPHRAFTIVELIAVIAIIAVLIALTLPVVKKAMETARITMCKTNLRSQHNSIHMIALDRQNERLPSGDGEQLTSGITPFTGSYRGDAFGVNTPDLIDYGYTEEIGICPSLTPDTGIEAQKGHWYYFTAGDNNGNDYIYNGGVGNGDTNRPIYGYKWRPLHGMYISLNRMVEYPYATMRNFELTPNQVVYISDTSYNNHKSYPGWYYASLGYRDPSNHRDDDIRAYRRGRHVWPTQATGGNRLKADGSVVWFELYKQYRTRGNFNKLPRWYKARCVDSYAAYW
ncbi:MAG: hypothetical protein CMJ49_01445 [Planctomycetaceae bacterium]|nr:hypothetical protein [Planctomycetaceae bacterium]